VPKSAPTSAEAAALRDLAEAAEVDVAAFLKQFKATAFESLTPEQLAKARGILEARLQKKR
jgi:hypothetical protein